MDSTTVQIGIVIFGSVGFWSFLTKVFELVFTKKSQEKKEMTNEEALLLGIAHDRIHYLCNQYRKRGYMDEDEVDTLEAIAEPYLKMGGNGSGERLYKECKKLPIKQSS